VPSCSVNERRERGPVKELERLVAGEAARRPGVRAGCHEDGPCGALGGNYSPEFAQRFDADLPRLPVLALDEEQYDRRGRDVAQLVLRSSNSADFGRNANAAAPAASSRNTGGY
jgi:hypothetical protein